MKIQCIDRQVKEILESGIFVIPRFQRPFSWDKDNIDEFWSDSTSVIKKDYFIGAFVTYQMSNGVFGVVDGQQRLTTITILLCVLRDKYKEFGFEARAKGIQNLIERRDLDNNRQFILKAESSYPYFQAKIQNYSGDDDIVDVGAEEERLIAAYHSLKGYVSARVSIAEKADNKNQKEKVKKELDLIRDKILGLNAISITLENQDDAYTIFETLNTRGKDLTVADLAKNHILRLLQTRNKELDRPKDWWDEIVQNLEQSSKTIQVKTFMHHQWLSKNEFVTEKQLFKSIRDSVNRDNARNFILNLKDDAVLYRGVFDPNDLDIWNPQNDDVRESLFAITNILNIQIASPLLLSILRRYAKKQMKDGQIRELFSLVEKYHFIHTTICGLPSSGGVSQMYALHAREISNAPDANSLGQKISEFKVKVRSRIPEKETFLANFPKVIYGNPRQKDVVKYILWKIERSRFPAIKADSDSLSIEHLMPQSVRKDYVNQLGNLILVPQSFNGSSLGAKPINDKLRLIKTGGRSVDDIQLDSMGNWTEEAIRMRTKELAEYSFETVWKIR